MLAFTPPGALTHWVGPLHTRLHGFCTAWPRYSSLRGRPHRAGVAGQAAQHLDDTFKVVPTNRENRSKRDRNGEYLRLFARLGQQVLRNDQVTGAGDSVEPSSRPKIKALNHIRFSMPGRFGN